MKALLSALKRSSSKSAKTASRTQRFADENEANNSPLAPKRLLSATPEPAKGTGGRQLSRAPSAAAQTVSEHVPARAPD